YGYRYLPQSTVPSNCATTGQTCTWVKQSDNALYYRKADGTDVNISAGGGGSTTLQQAYTNGAAGGGAFGLTSSGGPLQVKDNATPIGGHLFDVTDSGGTNHYLSVDAASTGSAVIDFDDGASAALSSTNKGRLIYNNTLHAFQVSSNGASFITLG